MNEKLHYYNFAYYDDFYLPDYKEKHKSNNFYLKREDKLFINQHRWL